VYIDRIQNTFRACGLRFNDRCCLYYSRRDSWKRRSGIFSLDHKSFALIVSRDSLAFKKKKKCDVTGTLARERANE